MILVWIVQKQEISQACRGPIVARSSTSEDIDKSVVIKITKSTTMKMGDGVSPTQPQNIRDLGECLIPIVAIYPVGRIRTAQIGSCNKQINICLLYTSDAADE